MWVPSLKLIGGLLLINNTFKYINVIHYPTINIDILNVLFVHLYKYIIIQFGNFLE